MPRFNVTMPQELWDRVGREADRSAAGNKSFVVRRALEAMLGEVVAGREVSDQANEGGAKPAAPVSPRAPDDDFAKKLDEIAEGWGHGRLQTDGS